MKTLNVYNFGDYLQRVSICLVGDNEIVWQLHGCHSSLKLVELGSLASYLLHACLWIYRLPARY